MTTVEPSDAISPSGRSAISPPDKGLQSERTSLSFVRTSLSILGLAVACLRWLPPFGSVAMIGPAIAAVLIVAVTIYERRSRSARLELFAREKATPALGMGAVLAVSLLVLAASGLWILVT
ncbi:DUF202 domain-containing protein [Rhodococcus sp. IEGM 1366]|uniref:DUF202 domain-containing protein n=1 Tax=unclassified Rhodococcus (in: high G+C Gram-positive bacteria) TaxID=192944 RepID=UPI000697B9D4|nr:MULTISPECIES: DUF202 domain-containing protein [unclassified Rhodococcus (in: high G+C Gram-positive bacteria)]MDV8065832.1 DUF202 domain-containing protein [Rhodococcus sp. IEGM 1366]